MLRLKKLPSILETDNLVTVDVSTNLVDVLDFTPSLTDESFYRPTSEAIRELPYMNHDNLSYDFPNGVVSHSVDLSLRKPIEDLSILSVKARASKRELDERFQNDLDEQTFNEKIEALKASSKDNSSEFGVDPTNVS